MQDCPSLGYVSVATLDNSCPRGRGVRTLLRLTPPWELLALGTCSSVWL